MDRIHFVVDGVKHSVGCDVASTTTLVDYLRVYLQSHGTKYMCRIGGCGACIVAAVKCPGGPTLSVNSCMVSITSCQGWDITTIQQLGNRKKGYHPLQQSMADNNASQCGYCSPAWVMNMYSVLSKSVQETGKKPTMLEIEQSFGSNVCRCTGYRPILTAFKKFANDYQEDDLIGDIEDLKICKKSGLSCKKTKCDDDVKCNDDVKFDDDDDDWCVVDAEESKIIEIRLKDNRFWYKVCDLESIFKILYKTGYESYMLVSGNTAKGVYPIDKNPWNLIDISSVIELKHSLVDQNLVAGAGLTLTELLDTFKTVSKEPNFEYLERMADHLKLVAHIAVRNLGSIGGNLMIKHQHNEFPSDIYLLFEAVGALLTIIDSRGISKIVTMQEFLREDMKGKVIVNAALPPLEDSIKFYSHKIMPRSQNAHAIVNGAFLYKLTSNNRVDSARIVFGGLSPHFNRAEKTERYLIGKNLFSDCVLQSALRVLDQELIVTENPPEPSVKSRKSLALALFYKGLISLCPKDILNKKYWSEADKIHDTRPVTEGRQIFFTNPTLWPLNQPIPKIEGLIQCAGEAEYVDDYPTQPREVHAAFVVTTVALGDIESIDASEALKQPGVIKFYTAKDIPGINSFTPAGTTFYVANEEVLCSGSVKYYNQPYGIIVAETSHIAEAAAKMVKATYKNIRKPTINIKDVVNDPSRLTLSANTPATDRGTDVAMTIKGQTTMYGQYHFMMENIACLTRPTEEGIEVFATTQWMDGVQMMISQALKIEENRIDVHVRRLGGAFGIKISRTTQVAVACSLVTLNMNCPCRLVLPLTMATRAMGKRLPCYIDYVCEVNSAGVIQHLEYKKYEDNGYIVNETLSALGNDVYNNCYNAARWDYTCYDATTDNASNTWCRSPGTTESISGAEQILERISYELDLDQFDVRIANLDIAKFGDLVEMANYLKTTAKYAERRADVDKFNKNNRWRKRGLRFSFLRWTPQGSMVYEVNISVFKLDGTVVITHGGIEMGQGINTKAVQIAAYYLKIPITKIQVKANNTIIAPNCFITGGSLGSQNVGLGVKRACEQLLARLEPIRRQMTNPTWEELIANAHQQNVSLQAHGFVNFTDIFMYDIYGVALSEVVIDVLTGEWECCRVDLLQDVGQSVNPEIDVGQVEGAFIMGMGYWTCENLVYDNNTGELLTDSTREYNVLLAKDIPQDFRIYFRKNSYTYEAIQGSKGTGEPPLCLSISVFLALREAISAARLDSGIKKHIWFPLDGPATVDKIALLSASKTQDFKLNN